MKDDVNLIAIDLGASSGRVILAHFSKQGLKLNEIHRFPNGPITQANHLHWDVLKIFDEIKVGLRKAAASYIINGLGIDTWGVDFALLDQNDRLVIHPFHYRDPQTNGMLQEVFKRVDRKEIFFRTGIQFLQLNTLYQLFAIRATPILKSAKTFLMMPDLFNFWLSGRIANEYTTATTTQFYNPTLENYDQWILSKLSLPVDIYPEIVPPGTILGKLTTTISDETGLGEVPVITPACHDTASAVVSVPIKSPHSAYISSGTWSLIGVETSKPIITKRSLAYNFTNEGGVYGTFRLLKNVTGLWLVQECRRVWKESGVKYSWKEITTLAIDAPGFVSFIDPDDPIFLKPDDMRLAIQDFCKKTDQIIPESPGAILRCIFESLALKYHWVIHCLEELIGDKIGEIHIIGGGSQNELLCQMTADTTGKDVIAGPIEATAIGNTIMQAIALGYIDSLAEGREMVSRSFPLITYPPKSNDGWKEAYQRFKEIVQKS